MFEVIAIISLAVGSISIVLMIGSILLRAYNKRKARNILVKVASDNALNATEKLDAIGNIAIEDCVDKTNENLITRIIKSITK